MTTKIRLTEKRRFSRYFGTVVKPTFLEIMLIFEKKAMVFLEVLGMEFGSLKTSHLKTPFLP
jgi:hypothetical protein